MMVMIMMMKIPVTYLFNAGVNPNSEAASIVE